MLGAKDKGDKPTPMTIRGVPRDIMESLEASATRNDRTREAEARVALKAWVSPESTPLDHATQYRMAVATRLQYALDQVKANVMGFSELSPSVLAELAGETSASQVVAGFHGETDLPFSMVERLSDLLGVAPKWVKHGNGAPYPMPLMRLTRSVKEGVDELLGTEPLRMLHLLRADDESGALYVIREHKDSARCDMFHTPYHISEQIGAGGEGDLCSLFQVFEHLYKRYTRHFARINEEENIDCVIKSYLVRSSVMLNREIAGQVHPLALVKRASEAPWWEDIWDNDQSREYWPGMLDLRQRIKSAIASQQARSEPA